MAEQDDTGVWRARHTQPRSPRPKLTDHIIQERHTRAPWPDVLGADPRRAHPRAAGVTADLALLSNRTDLSQGV